MDKEILTLGNIELHHLKTIVFLGDVDIEKVSV